MFHPKQKIAPVCVDEQQSLPEVPYLRLVASVKLEAVAFFYEHGCAIQQRQKHHQDDLVIFPAVLVKNHYHQHAFGVAMSSCPMEPVSPQ